MFHVKHFPFFLVDVMVAYPPNSTSDIDVFAKKPFSVVFRHGVPVL